MKLTKQDITENAQDWIGASQGLTAQEQVDREQLKEQFAFTIADDDDIEAIAQEIERIRVEAIEPAPKPEPSDVDDLFSVTHEDIQGKHDGNSTDDGDYSEVTMLTDEDEGDVIEVTDADIYGEAPTTRRSVRRFQRTQRSYQPPPSSLGGMRV